MMRINTLSKPLRRLATSTTVSTRQRPKYTNNALLRRSLVVAPRGNNRTRLACMSTAPLPKQGAGISYEEWAANKAAEQSSSPQRQARTSRRAKPGGGTTLSLRPKPQKYNSLVVFPETVSLKWPSQSSDDQQQFQLNCLDFAISKPEKAGGHVVLGRNGIGKSLLVQYLSHPELFADETLYTDDDAWKLLSADEIAYVSLDSHLQILRDQPHLTVHDSITGGAGNLSKAAQYLVVRFGLKPLLHRTVSTLSTGEIRKCLVVSALSKEPRLLILENAFDGLDPDSRHELQSIVSQTIRGLGKSSKLLVQHVNAESVPPAQVLMSTHRPEEIVDDISTISLVMEQETKEGTKNHAIENNTLVTIPRPDGFSQEQLMFMALGLDKDHNKSQTNWSILAPWEDDDPTLVPSLEEIQSVWSSSDHEQADDDHGDTTTPETTLISLDNVAIRRLRDGRSGGGEDVDDKTDNSDDTLATLLHPLSWKIQKGQRWLIAGGNGAGKSTLSRFLLASSTDDHQSSDENQEEQDSTRDLTSGVYRKDVSTKIGWVSTESHLGSIVNDDVSSPESTTARSAWDVIRRNGEVLDSVAETMVRWVFGSSNDTSEAILSKLQRRPLEEFSQGEQKLALIASALAVRPNLLILDEPTQGLDWGNRRRVLALLERLCQARSDDLSLVFITHYQEEWIPSISHVLHLDDGCAIYQGPKEGYSTTQSR